MPLLDHLLLHVEIRWAEISPTKSAWLLDLIMPELDRRLRLIGDIDDHSKEALKALLRVASYEILGAVADPVLIAKSQEQDAIKASLGWQPADPKVN